MNDIALLYTTVSSLEVAQKLAQKAVLEKQAVCVNIVPQALSIYMWEEKVAQSSECLLLFKTDITRLETLQSWLNNEHPYVLPAIIKGQ